MRYKSQVDDGEWCSCRKRETETISKLKDIKIKIVVVDVSACYHMNWSDKLVMSWREIGLFKQKRAEDRGLSWSRHSGL